MKFHRLANYISGIFQKVSCRIQGHRRSIRVDFVKVSTYVRIEKLSTIDTGAHVHNVLKILDHEFPEFVLSHVEIHYVSPRFVRGCKT